MPQIRKNTPRSLNVAELQSIVDPIDNYADKIYAAACWYSQQRIAIVPFLKKGYPKGMSQRDASYHIDRIDEWFHPIMGRFAGASIAMAHGGEAGTIAVDLDNKKADGLSTLADLELMYGNYDDGEGIELQTLMATTPSGGRHLVFQFHPEIISNSEKSYGGIDTRGGNKKDPSINGGITFVEPSAKPDGSGYYRWDTNHTEIRQIPQWLVDVLNGRTPAKRTGIQLQDAYVESAMGDHGEGRDRNIYMDLLRFVGVGYTEDQIIALRPEILARMQPPDEAMVDAKIESVLASEAFQKAQEEIVEKKAVASIPLVRDSKERLVNCIENLRLILSSPIFDYEYGLIEYDDFTQNFIRDKTPLASVVDWSVGIQSWVSSKFKLDFPKTTIRDHVEDIAFQRPHANIAREYMLNAAANADTIDRPQDYWGSGRLGGGRAFDRLCYEVLDLGNMDLHPNYTCEIRDAYIGFLWFWLQGVAARACVPACKMEIVLNIFGGQGIGKSLFFRELCPNPKWFTDSLQDSIVGGGQNNRDELLKLHAKIIVEMPELNPIKRGGKSADDKLKQFISAQVDNFRRAYGHDAIDHPRTCALAGTSNNRDVYRDSTGARRFVSIDHGSVAIRVGDRDRGIMDEIRDDLWGEVVSSFNEGELSPNTAGRLMVVIPAPLRELQSKVNDAHRFEEIGVKEITEWLYDKTRVTWDEIIHFSKQVAGLRDAKETVVMAQVRKELSNDLNWEFKRRVMRTDPHGKKEKTNCWVNLASPHEANIAHGAPAPEHWSKYQPVDTSREEY